MVDREEDLIQQSMPIPEYKMGWIIGKKGTYIKQLCQKSGEQKRTTLYIDDNSLFVRW